LLFIQSFSIDIVSDGRYDKFIYNQTFTSLELLYKDIWGTIYNARGAQCDDSPNITGDGSVINPDSASQYRWIAISQDMLKDSIRAKILSNDTIDRFKGRIKYSDTVWIESDNPNINGWWVVHDAKNKRCYRNIDFLQTYGDKSLYYNNRYWNGKFMNLKIFKINHLYYNTYKK
jgi:hypothetical protein